MTGEEGKCGGGTGAGGDAGVGNTNLTDNVNNVNANVHANVNANINVSQQNGGPEKAPVVGGTNVETLPRAGKQTERTGENLPHYDKYLSKQSRGTVDGNLVAI
ncbi:hypothetical protein K0M31_007978 [Melipona bicolor]|uniref:Uncharacterized protein n=1 Tax=Melipona bicolor TaxID=60889 RepID=A0AA40GCP1_9HYME|nr:hypothetical protein K0M31_007978 [Melipona bicolor]